MPTLVHVAVAALGLTANAHSKKEEAKTLSAGAKGLEGGYEMIKAHPLLAERLALKYMMQLNENWEVPNVLKEQKKVEAQEKGGYKTTIPAYETEYMCRLAKTAVKVCKDGEDPPHWQGVKEDWTEVCGEVNYEDLEKDAAKKCKDW